MHRKALPIWIAGLLSLGSACEFVDRTRGREVAVDTAAVSTTAGVLALGMEVPGMLRPGEEGVVRLSLTNRGDTIAHGMRLDLLVPGWMEPLTPEPGGREVTIAASPEEGTRLSYRMDDPPVQPGETQTVEQRIRFPATSPVTEGATPWSRVIRARLAGPDGQPLAEVESEVALDTLAMGRGDTTRLAQSPRDTAGGDARGDRPAIERDRLGPARLGMTTGALRQAASGARDTTWTREGTRERGQVVPLQGGGRAIAVLAGDTISRIEVRDTIARTREGLGVGSRFEELRSAYGRTCADVAKGEVVVWFPNAPGVSFALDARVPENAAQLRENPERIPGSARVTRWWLRRGPDRC
ncbi:hypothetical protein BH23GEM7_BH23GEM7_20750 [soil metagenome]